MATDDSEVQLVITEKQKKDYSQDLTLEVVTPEAAAGSTEDKSGCVAIVIGFK